MFSIVLLCSGGMSSSFIVDKIKLATSDSKYEFEINSYGVHDLSVARNAHLVLLAPQVGYQKRLIQNKLTTRRVAIIDRKDYGTMNGNAVFKQILEILELES